MSGGGSWAWISPEMRRRPRGSSRRLRPATVAARDGGTSPRKHLVCACGVGSLEEESFDEAAATASARRDCLRSFPGVATSQRKEACTCEARGAGGEASLGHRGRQV